MKQSWGGKKWGLSALTGLGIFVPILRYLSVFVAIGVLGCWFTVGVALVVRWWYVGD